jgi:hypothetical protein
MRVIAGTFRISIVAAIFVAAWVFAGGYLDASTADSEVRHRWRVLRCGERFLDQDMRQYTTQNGLIDIGKAGCSPPSFLASLDEVRTALLTTQPPDAGKQFWNAIRLSGKAAAINAIFVILIINLCGFLCLAVLTVYRRLQVGYRHR